MRPQYISFSGLLSRPVQYIATGDLEILCSGDDHIQLDRKPFTTEQHIRKSYDINLKCRYSWIQISNGPHNNSSDYCYTPNLPSESQELFFLEKSVVIVVLAVFANKAYIIYLGRD